MTDDENQEIETKCRGAANDAFLVIRSATALIEEAIQKQAFQPFAFHWAIDSCLGNAATAMIHALLSLDFTKLDGLLDLEGVDSDSFLRREINELTRYGERIRVKDE